MKIFKLSYLGIFICMLIAGCGSDTVTPPTSNKITVSGKVIDTRGNGIMNVTVAIRDAIQTTASDGSFTISNVTTPYDLKAVSGTSGLIYKGLSSSSPQIYGIGIASTPNSANLNVNIPPLLANQTAVAVFTDQSYVHFSNNIVFPATSTTLNVQWPGNPAITGRVIVLVYTVSGGLISTYDKYGEKIGFTLNNGSPQTTTFTPAELATNPGESNVSGSLVVPGGYTSPQTRLQIKFSSAGSIATAATLLLTNMTTFNFVVPTGLSTSFILAVVGQATGPISGQSTAKAIVVASGSSGNTINLNTPPTLNTPPNGANGVDTTTNFTYTAGASSGFYVIYFSSASASFFVFTNSTTAQMPNFSAFGLPIGSMVSYSWNNQQFPTIPTVDAFVSAALYNNPSFTELTTSEVRTFTTAP